MKRIFAVLLFSAVMAHADVMIRYRMSTSAQSAVSSPGEEFHEIRMRGDKGITSDGLQTTIVNFATRQISIVDTARKKFATVSSSEYEDHMSAMMPPFNFGSPTDKNKPKVESRKTGRAETILGAQTEESEITASIELVVPGVAEAPKLGMRIVRQEWSATPTESLRIPAIHQLAGFDLWQESFMGGAGMLTKMLSPGDTTFADALRPNPGALRWNMKMYMTMPGVDASVPFVEMKYEVVSLSSDPIEARLFEIPADYQSTSLTEVMNGSVRDRQLAAKQPAAEQRNPEPGEIQVYVPGKTPLHQTGPRLPEEARSAGVQGMVELLITLDTTGHAVKAEPLSGPDVLRKAAVQEIKDWTWRPVLRNGVGVAAYTNATVTYIDPNLGRFTPSMTDLMQAERRKNELEKAMPRTIQQKIDDLEQDSQGGGVERRFYALGKIAETALAAGNVDKADAAARELLALAVDLKKDWNYGNAIHDGHMTLGLIAAGKNDIGTADRELLEAGRTPGSPQLNSFGPNMALADILLKKGESATVLDYLSSCGTFWKLGQDRLTTWSDAIRQGKAPSFGVSVRTVALQ